MPGIFDFFWESSKFVWETEILNASLPKLIDLTSVYKDNMVFWSKGPYFGVAASTVTVPLFIFALLQKPKSNPQTEKEQQKEFEWKVLAGGAGVLAAVSMTSIQLSKKFFNDYSNLYNRCVQRLLYDFNYKP